MNFLKCALPQMAVSALALAGLTANFGRGEEPVPKSEGATAPAKAPATVNEALNESWPDRPEWVDMFADIMEGSQLGPNDGWFRRAKAQTRFTWAEASKHYDKDSDGVIARAEFPGGGADFARLDRDKDGVLTAHDFDFSAHALAPSPGAMLFYRADRDGNGKLTREELEAFFKANDSGKLGFLSLGDLQAALPMPEAPAPAPAPSVQAKPSQAARAEESGPTKATLVRGLFRQGIGSLQPGPALNETAPDFTLKTVSGGESITLSKVLGPKPVVLIFGNITCGPFRSQAGNVDKLFRMYQDRARFLMVYVREAHPIDGWRMESNERVGVSIAQPSTYEDRRKTAETCAGRLDLGFPVLVDDLDDAIGARYSGMPSRLYLLDSRGGIAYKSGRGPFGFKPAELEQSLIMLLNNTPEEKVEARGVESARAGRSSGSEGRRPSKE